MFGSLIQHKVRLGPPICLSGERTLLSPAESFRRIGDGDLGGSLLSNLASQQKTTLEKIERTLMS